MNYLWNLDINTAIEWYELLNKIQEDLKKELTREETEIVFLEFMKIKNIKPIGRTDKDIDQICGEIRESDPKFKVLNFNEIERRRKKK